MNYKQFKQYLKEHGMTAARTTEDWCEVPKGTVLWFAYQGGGISTNPEKNMEFGYDFEYRYWWDDYKGNFELVHGWDYLKKGDILVDGDYEIKVLAVVDDVVFVSSFDNFERASSNNYTKQELQKLGYTIKDAPDPKIIEVSIDEIAKFKGVSPDRIRVKKEE